MGSIIYFLNPTKKHPLRNTMVGTIIGSAVLIGGIWEAALVRETGYWNPARQIEYKNIEYEKAKKREDRFNELHKEFLSHADRDKNGYIDFAEQVDAWRRMGYEGPFFESKGASQFPNPTLERLEKAVENYKRD